MASSAERPPSRLPSPLESLNPAYFALVMATGIVSLACRLLEMPWLSLALFALNIGAFVILWLLNLARIVLFPRKFWADLIDHRRGVGFFTSVAATCLLGTQCLLIAEWRTAATCLWCLGVVLLIVLTYTQNRHRYSNSCSPFCVD